jgi:hypothetical protein
VDFSVTDTVTIEAGQSSVIIPISVADDEIEEDDETIILTITGCTDCIIHETENQFTYTILNNDFAGVALSHSVVAVTEAGSWATYSLALTSKPTAEVQVQLHIFSGHCAESSGQPLFDQLCSEVCCLSHSFFTVFDSEKPDEIHSHD